MTNQTDRDAFEKMQKNKFGEKSYNLSIYEGKYLNDIIQRDFEVWQAATAYARQDAIEEIKKMPFKATGGLFVNEAFINGYTHAKEQIIRALQSKGE